MYVFFAFNYNAAEWVNAMLIVVEQEPLSRVPATQPSDLQQALHHFSVWLSGLEVVQSPRLAQLTVQRMHAKIHQEALARLAKTYKTICEEIKKPENRYEAASTLLGRERPFGQVHLLWQVFGLEEEDYDDEEESDEESESIDSANDVKRSEADNDQEETDEEESDDESECE